MAKLGYQEAQERPRRGHTHAGASLCPLEHSLCLQPGRGAMGSGNRRSEAPQLSICVQHSRAPRDVSWEQLSCRSVRTKPRPVGREAAAHSRPAPDQAPGLAPSPPSGRCPQLSPVAHSDARGKGGTDGFGRRGQWKGVKSGHLGRWEGSHAGRGRNGGAGTVETRGF